MSRIPTVWKKTLDWKLNALDKQVFMILYYIPGIGHMNSNTDFCFFSKSLKNDKVRKIPLSSCFNFGDKVMFIPRNTERFALR